MVTLTDYLNYLYDTREDKDNIYPVGIYDNVFRRYCSAYLLSPRYYTEISIDYNLSAEQKNVIALNKILKKYSIIPSFIIDKKEISDREFRQIAIDYLLGKDWYITDPLSQTQINEVALIEILERYSKVYKKEIRRNRKV